MVQKSIYILKPLCVEFFLLQPILIKIRVTQLDLVEIYFTVTSQKNQSTNWVMFPILVNFTNQVKICCLIWRMLAKLSYSVRKMLFYEALTCSCMLGIIDPILILIDPFFQKKSIAMIFGCGDRFTSLIRRYLAQLRETFI